MLPLHWSLCWVVKPLLLLLGLPEGSSSVSHRSLKKKKKKVCCSVRWIRVYNCVSMLGENKIQDVRKSLEHKWVSQFKLFYFIELDLVVLKIIDNHLKWFTFLGGTPYKLGYSHRIPAFEIWDDWNQLAYSPKSFHQMESLVWPFPLTSWCLQYIFK